MNYSPTVLSLRGLALLRFAFLSPQPVADKVVRHTEQPRRGGDVALARIEGQMHEMINGIVQNNALGRKTERWIEPSWLIADTGRASLGRVARQPGEIQFCPRLKNNRSLQFMRQFAHIAGPTVAQQ